MSSTPLSLRDTILNTIIEGKKSESFVIQILYDEYGKKWLLDFLGQLSPKDLNDLLEHKEWYDSFDFCKNDFCKNDFCKRIQSVDFTKISYEVFAISIKYHCTGILEKLLLITGKRLKPSIVYAIHNNMTPNLRRKFLQDNFDISVKDLIRLAEGKVGYRALRRKAITQHLKSISKIFPFLPKKRRTELSTELSKYIIIRQYKKTDITVNINGSSYTATLYAITMRDISDPNSIPSDYGYIFIEFHEKYIEIICREIRDYEGYSVEGALGDSRAKLIDGCNRTPVFVYSIYEDYDPENFDRPDKLYIPKSTNLQGTFENLVSIDVEFEKRRGYRDSDFDYLDELDNYYASDSD